MLKRLGNGLWNKFGLVGFRLQHCSKALTKHGVLGMCFVEGITYMSSGTGKSIIVRLVEVTFG